MKALQIEDLCAYYGKAQILHGINLSVGQGELVSLLGPNGAGKSTTLKAIAGTVLTRGRIRVGGREVGAMPAYKRVTCGIGYSPEGRRLFSELSVHKNLLLGAYSRSDRAGIYHDLERVFELFPRLRERSRQQVSTLSGGEQQMVAIARAMMARPSLLLLDEPSVGIAVRLKDAMFETIRAICDGGVAILLVEQDVNATLAIADRNYILEAGRVVADGTSEMLAADERIQQAFFGR